MTVHDLTIEDVDSFDLAGTSLTKLGRCSCGLFSMLGTERSIRDFYPWHKEFVMREGVGSTDATA
jgi:hypothetical protein